MRVELPDGKISIHTPLAGSDPIRRQQHPKRHISIHTPLAGSDYAARVVHGEHVDFNPHSPCGERPNHSRSIQQSLTFQSTLPLRGATIRTMQHDRLLQHFNPHSPCGERPGRPCVRSPALRFQSTLPLRGATQSEHRGLRIRNFNPHSPCGERPVALLDELIEHLFQSTLPLRGATGRALVASGVERISIHTPLAGSDNLSTVSWKAVPYFNPHSPCGERPADLKILD